MDCSFFKLKILKKKLKTRYF